MDRSAKTSVRAWRSSAALTTAPRANRPPVAASAETPPILKCINEMAQCPHHRCRNYFLKSSAHKSQIFRTPARANENRCLRREHLLDECATGGEQILDLRQVLAARFREVGPAAAAAADDRRQLFDYLTGRDFLRQVWCDADDDGDLAVGG